MKFLVCSAILLGALSASLSADASCAPLAADCACESDCGSGFSFGANYLYWKAQQRELPTHEISHFTPISGTPAVDRSRTHVPDFDFESGFRVFGGYAIPCMFDLKLSYTYIPGESDYNLAPRSGEDPIDLLFSSVKGHWKATFQYLDLDVSRTLQCAECLSVKPHIGFRAMWGDQKLKEENILAEAFEFEGAPVNYTPIRGKECFHGYGVEGGLWAEWNVLCNFSLVGHVGGSILYTRMNHHTQFFFGSRVDDNTTIFSVSHNTQHVCDAIASLDYFVGVKYSDCMCGWNITAQAGWESHVWFDLGNVAFDQGGSTGNFTTQGLTLGVAVGF